MAPGTEGTGQLVWAQPRHTQRLRSTFCTLPDTLKIHLWVNKWLRPLSHYFFKNSISLSLPSKLSCSYFWFLCLYFSLLGFFSSSKSFKSVWGKRILRRNFCLRIRWSENTRSTSHMVTIVYIQVALIPFNGGFDLQFGQLPPLNKCLIPGQLHTFMLCLALWLFLIYAPIKTKFLKPFYSFQNILVLKPILSSQ